MPPVKVAGIGSKAREADSFILSVTAAKEVLLCHVLNVLAIILDYFWTYYGLLLDILSTIMAFKRIMTILNPHLFPLKRLFTLLWHLVFESVIN